MSDPNIYTVGWICSIETEYLAAQLCLDEEHPKLNRHPSPNDTNTYTLGKVAEHNVVIAALPDGSYGTSSAAAVAINLLRSFPNVRIGLMVGIGGGAPSLPDRDIRLGDIVVSSPGDGKGGVFQYDFGKTIQGQGFQETRFLNQPPTALRTAVIDLKVEHKRRPASLEKAISSILEKEEEDLKEEFDRPDASSDRLYRSSFVHPLSMKTNCKETCGVSPLNLVPRPARTKRPHTPVVHYGLIASGNQLMKDALRRDELANKKKVLCFEMEAAGLMDDFPCLVVRGIWNYSDTHTNDEWQSYAALVAAAYAKELLKRIPPDHVEAEKRIADFLSDIQGEVKDVSRGVDKLARRQYDQVHQAILNWLTPVENSTEHNDFIYRRQEGTGQWLLNSDKFQVWLNTDKPTLFCLGIPGAEETIMTAIVIDCCQEKFRDDQSVGIAYIYCSFQEQIKRPENLLASLLKQLTQRQSSLPRSVKDLYDRHTKDQTTPSFNEISRALHSVATTYSRVFIIIDALDECQISDDSQTRLVNRTKFLKEIFNLQDNVVANIFATSRPSKEIPNFFSKCLSLTITATDADILTYLNAKTSDIMDDEMRDTIRKGVLKAAGGMYVAHLAG
ncbi:ankyrin repeat protein [Ustulina deusta]|nr:ankyrin repeat protein [Ustulina deusta]